MDKPKSCANIVGTTSADISTRLTSRMASRPNENDEKIASATLVANAGPGLQEVHQDLSHLSETKLQAGT
jgi:hypothetical protein